VREAVVEGASLRLRPILMTTGAMVLGALPLALSTGAGAESRQQIGWVIVGGMSLGTLLTIFVVPTVYTLFARKAVPGEIRLPEEDQPHGATSHEAQPPKAEPQEARQPAPTVVAAGAAGD
jgi:multidrug efflux pump